MTPAVLAHAYWEVFTASPAGQMVLADLMQRFARPATTTGGIDAVLKTYCDAGARRVLDHILAMADRGANPGVAVADFDLPDPMETS